MVSVPAARTRGLVVLLTEIQAVGIRRGDPQPVRERYQDVEHAITHDLHSTAQAAELWLRLVADLHRLDVREGRLEVNRLTNAGSLERKPSDNRAILGDAVQPPVLEDIERRRRADDGRAHVDACSTYDMHCAVFVHVGQPAQHLQRSRMRQVAAVERLQGLDDLPYLGAHERSKLLLRRLEPLLCGGDGEGDAVRLRWQP